MTDQLEEHFKSGVQSCLKSFLKDENVQGKFLLKSDRTIIKISAFHFQKKNCRILSEPTNGVLFIWVQKMPDCCPKAEAKARIAQWQYSKKEVWIIWRMILKSSSL